MATVPIFSQDVRPAPEVPTVHEPTDKDLDNIVNNVSAKYHRVLIHLGLSSNTIETLEIKHQKDPARILFDGLVRWRNKKTKSSQCLWEDLLKAIEEGAENEIYAEEWRTELQERGIETSEHRPEMEDCGDVKGSHLGSTASASAAELKTRSGTSLRRRQVLPQQQKHQQQQQQQPVQKRSDKPCSSQDASRQTSANKTKTSDLNGHSSSNCSAYCHSPPITTVPIGLHQKASSPAIAQGDLKELHQSLIQYIQVACRLVRHRETEMEYLNTAADYFQSAFKMSDIAKVVGSGLAFVSTFLLITGYVLHHILYRIDLNTLIILMAMKALGLICILLGLVAVFGPLCIGYRKHSKVLNGTVNWIKYFIMLCLQLEMAHLALLRKLNAIKQEYGINDKYDVLRQTFKSLKMSNTQFTLERFLLAQRQMENKAVMSYVARLAAATSAEAVAPPRHLVLVMSLVMLALVGATIIGVVSSEVIFLAVILPIGNLILIMTAIFIRKLTIRCGISVQKFDELASCETDRFQLLAQLFNSIIPGRLTWLRKTRHQLLFT